MEKIAFIVDRLNVAPFSQNFSTLAEFDSKSSLELFNLLCQVLVAIDPDQEAIYKESIQFQSQRIIQFLRVMKFEVEDGMIEVFKSLISTYDKETIQEIIFWSLQRFETLQKRSYLARFLLPVDVPSEFLNDDLTNDLQNSLRDLQAEFKDVHKAADKAENSGKKITEIKGEISQMEQEKVQLQNKINKMKKEVHVDDSYFNEMLKATAALRKEQEDEANLYQRLREHRQSLQDAEGRFSDANKRFTTARAGGALNQSPDQLLAKLQKDCKDLFDKKEALELEVSEKTAKLEKFQSVGGTDRVTTHDDVQVKREQVRSLEEDLNEVQQHLNAALEKNPKLTVFRQASSMAQKKLRDREEEHEKVVAEVKRLTKTFQDKEAAYEVKVSKQGQGDKNGLGSRAILAESVRLKGDKYRRLQEHLAGVRGELVILQRTEQILRNQYLATVSNLSGGAANAALEALVEETEKKRLSNGPMYALGGLSEGGGVTDSSDAMTLDQLAATVDQLSREFKSRQTQLQPVMNELRLVRQEFSEVEAEHTGRRVEFEKMTVGLEMEKLSLERECDECQDECLREESRFHYLTQLLAVTRVRLDRAEQERRWRAGEGRLMRDFTSYKELYTHKLTQQEQLVKSLRKNQRDLKDTADRVAGQKVAYQNLQKLLTAKLQVEYPQEHLAQGGGSGSNSAPITQDRDNFILL